MSDAGQLSFLPVTAERLGDLRRFSEAFGKFRYCSCMRWRLPSSEFARSDASQRARRLEQLVQSSLPVGILAYQGDEPVGWCSIAPRETYVALERSRKISSSGEAGTWSVVCFFVAPEVRGVGLQDRLLAKSISYARDEGASTIEAYPWPGGSSYRYMGTRELYGRNGFADVPVPHGTRPVMRLELPAREK